MRSNLRLSLLQADWMAVVLEIIQTLRGTLARLLSGTVVIGQALMPTLKPAGDHSTNWMVLFVFMIWMAELISFATASPLKSSTQAMYFPSTKYDQ